MSRNCEHIPEDILADLARARALHDRVYADFAQCNEFSRLMNDILARLEDAKCWTAADRVMAVLLDCNPKQGSHCDKIRAVGERMAMLSPPSSWKFVRVCR